MYLDLSEENLLKTHIKTIEIIPPMMFHDLEGKPLMMKETTLIR
jgi:hypothetical protein